jgi:hypothetical protein
MCSASCYSTAPNTFSVAPGIFASPSMRAKKSELPSCIFPIHECALRHQHVVGQGHPEATTSKREREEVRTLGNFTHHTHTHRYYIINYIINLQDLSEKIASNIQNPDKDMDFSRFFPLKYPKPRTRLYRNFALKYPKKPDKPWRELPGACLIIKPTGG